MITLKEYEIYLKVKAFIETEGCQRDSKMRVLVKINTFWGHFCGAPRVLCKIEKVQKLQFHY